MAGPLIIDGVEHMIPMAIDISNACKALNMSGGVSTAVYRQSVSQIKIILCPNVTISKDIQDFIITNYSAIESLFNSTSISSKLQNIWCNMGGRNLYVRISYTERDIMESDAVNSIIQRIINNFRCVSINTNICSNNVNWVKGSGISISADCTIPHDVVKNILNTTVDDLIKIHNIKMVGNAMMGSTGESINASKIATCLLAIGQTNNLNAPCITLMNKSKNDLYVSVTMPSLQSSEHTARMIVSCVMAGELIL